MYLTEILILYFGLSQEYMDPVGRRPGLREVRGRRERVEEMRARAIENRTRLLDLARVRQHNMEHAARGFCVQDPPPAHCSSRSSNLEYQRPSRSSGRYSTLMSCTRPEAMNYSWSNPSVDVTRAHESAGSYDRYV